jgi:predicted phage baseplate assembly protein
MPVPLENIDNKRYEDFVKEAVKQVPIYAPQWTDYNPQDPGITLIELFAWLMEMQLYRLDRIPKSLYRKFFKLMGLEGPRPAVPARVELQFTPRPGSGGSVTLPGGTRAAAPYPGGEIIFTTLEELVLEDKPGVVLAEQTHALDPCYFSATGLPYFSIKLEHSPVQRLAVSIEDKETGRWRTWKAVDDFDASKPGDLHYIPDSTSGSITFGDGVNGKIPGQGEGNIKLTYTSGGGEGGNVPSHAITRVTAGAADSVYVDNPLPASGGKEPETMAEAIQRLRKDLRTVHRAVTPEDYETLALNMPGNLAARAKALPNYHPSYPNPVHGLVTVIVVLREDREQEGVMKQTLTSLLNVLPGPFGALGSMMRPLLPGKLQRVYHHLEKHRLLATQLLVTAADYVKIEIAATVVMKITYMKSSVEEAVRRELDRFLDPLHGGNQGNGWPFGRAVYLSEIYNIIHKATGVDYVEHLQIACEGQTHGPEDIIIPKHSLVTPGTHRITVLEDRTGEGG